MLHIVATAGGYESDDAVAAIDQKTWVTSSRYLSQLNWNESMKNSNKLKPEPEPEPEQPESDKKSYTKNIKRNVKGNRKVVIADFSFTRHYAIPDGPDLEDKSKVKQRCVHGDELHIVLGDGTTQNIQGDFHDEYDLKNAEKATVQDADDWGLVK